MPSKDDDGDDDGAGEEEGEEDDDEAVAGVAGCLAESPAKPCWGGGRNLLIINMLRCNMLQRHHIIYNLFP